MSSIWNTDLKCGVSFIALPSALFLWAFRLEQEEMGHKYNGLQKQ